MKARQLIECTSRRTKLRISHRWFHLCTPQFFRFRGERFIRVCLCVSSSVSYRSGSRTGLGNRSMDKGYPPSVCSPCVSLRVTCPCFPVSTRHLFRRTGTTRVYIKKLMYVLARRDSKSGWCVLWCSDSLRFRDRTRNGTLTYWSRRCGLHDETKEWSKEWELVPVSSQLLLFVLISSVSRLVFHLDVGASNVAVRFDPILFDSGSKFRAATVRHGQISYRRISLRPETRRSKLN